MKKFKLVGTYPKGIGMPATGKFTDEQKCKEYADKFNISYEEIEEPAEPFDDVILY